MLAGRHPEADVLGDDPTELLRRQLTMMPPLLADVANLPPQVDVVVRRAIAKDPAERYGSAMEMARALADLHAWVARRGAREAASRSWCLPASRRCPATPTPGATTGRPSLTPSHEAPPSGPRDARVVVARGAALPRP